MQIAAAGKSTIGIPADVGKEFVKEDKKVAHKEEYGKETQGEAGKRNRRVMAKSHNYAGMNPGYKQRSPMPKYSTGGTMGGGAAGSNAEYRHDAVKKKRNPQTRGSAGAYAMIAALRNPGQSSAEMKGGKYHNPHRGGY